MHYEEWSCGDPLYRNNQFLEPLIFLPRKVDSNVNVYIWSYKEKEVFMDMIGMDFNSK